MEHHITLLNTPITYLYKISPRSRSVSIKISPLGILTLTTSARISKEKAELFLHSKSEWILQHLLKLKKHPKLVLSTHPKKDYLMYKVQAEKLAHERVSYYAILYGFIWKSITIRNQKTRWGSCSKQGALSFNYKIALLDRELCDYIIVHELCHLKEFNHGPEFWNLVSKTIPNYEKRRAKMKLYL